MRLLVALVMLLLFACLVWFQGDSTCLVLYGPKETWAGFMTGFTSVYPNAQLVNLPEPELDFTAYCDALEVCAGKFRRLVCQVPNRSAADALSRRQLHGTTTVAIDSPSDLLPDCVGCNIVQTEQAFAQELIGHVDAEKEGKRCLLSTGPLRAPKGWVHLQAGKDPVDAVRAMSGFQLAAVVVAVPIKESTVKAIMGAAPGADVLAVSVGERKIEGLSRQISLDHVSRGRLAGMMLSAPYRGPRDVVVAPVVIFPDPSAIAMEPVTTLRQLACAAA